MKITEKSTEKEAETKEEKKDDNAAAVFSALMSDNRPELRLTGIYGDINEERCSEAVYDPSNYLCNT